MVNLKSQIVSEKVIMLSTNIKKIMMGYAISAHHEWNGFS